MDKDCVLQHVCVEHFELLYTLSLYRHFIIYSQWTNQTARDLG